PKMWAEELDEEPASSPVPCHRDAGEASPEERSRSAHPRRFSGTKNIGQTHVHTGVVTDVLYDFLSGQRIHVPVLFGPKTQRRRRLLLQFKDLTGKVSTLQRFDHLVAAQDLDSAFPQDVRRV